MKKLFLPLIFIFTACSMHNEPDNGLKNEIIGVTQCQNTNANYKYDCLELLSSRNSMAILQLGIMHEQKGEYQKAYNLFKKAYESKNIYSYAALARLYLNENFKDRKKAKELLYFAKNKDPMASYLFATNFETKKDLYLNELNFAAKAGIKKAQKLLIKEYTNKGDFKKVHVLEEMLLNVKTTYEAEIYGL